MSNSFNGMHFLYLQKLYKPFNFMLELSAVKRAFQATIAFMGFYIIL